MFDMPPSRMFKLDILLPVLISFLSYASSTTATDTTLPKPTAADFTKLNTTVQGRLHPGVPWTEPCFTVYNGHNVTQDLKTCGLVQEQFFDHIARTNAFGAYSLQNWEQCMATGDQCGLDFLNLTDPLAFEPPAVCNQGSISDFYIDVQGEGDVKAALDFVSTFDVPLVIKNTGHDYKGRSAAPGSLALWTHNLKNITLKPSFVSEGCPSSSSLQPQQALTIGAGGQWQEVYGFADAHGLQVVGGSDPGVGAVGGWVQGGGHSSLSPMFGMGVDRVLQYKVVTPDGVSRTVNSCQNTDLFFALRGGGGGTFAIVLEATIMASPAQTFQVASINWPITDQNMKQVLAMLVDNATSIATQAWGGYFTPTSGSLVLINSKLTTQEAQKTMQPLIDLTTRMGGISNVTEFPNYLDWFNTYVNGAQEGVGIPNTLTSRLIPEANHETPEGRAQILDALVNALENSLFSQIHFTTPFAFKGTDGNDTSINPVWRTSLYQVVLIVPWAYNATLAAKQAAYAQGTKAVNFLRDVTPDSGAYLNESDVHEPNHEVSFWGANHARLLGIKNKYDPRRVLDCWQCVGWKGLNDPRYKCYI